MGEKRRAAAPVVGPASAWRHDVVAGYPKSSTVAANVPPVKPLAVLQSVVFDWLSGAYVRWWRAVRTRILAKPVERANELLERDAC